ncbi:MAG: UDP-N-acetylmuramoyl-L-alanyl-D-glutamate--2,6-diaminopimelate ligase [Methylacidiphilales bacterium]|nr:UDP-N-acetylmuramoyl-L-alanyl-D-glutamate--2,6-diaminopimelate ligase [Candidatus Methylacidiphilales bacterium]
MRSNSIADIDYCALQQCAAISTVSSKVVEGGAFFAVRGDRQHGNMFINEAINRGSTMLVTDELQSLNIDHAVLSKNINYFYHPQLTVLHPFIINKFWIKKLSLQSQAEVIAVTGTNGKSTIVTLLEQLLPKCKSIGTLSGSGLTTPDVGTLQQWSAQYHLSGVAYIALEVSSHALTQRRVDALRITSAHFTNITHDHLDYHKTFENYRDSKFSLFIEYNLHHATICITDEISKSLVCTTNARKITCVFDSDSVFDLPDYAQGIRVGLFQATLKGLSFWFEFLDRDKQISKRYTTTIIPFYGVHSLRNLGSVISELQFRNIGHDEILTLINSVLPVPGRMQLFLFPNVRHVFVDYAHTPDAMTQTLQALTLHGASQIICLFGCGGNRDVEKRPRMGKIAEEKSSLVILTNDNPREEDPLTIIKNIQKGMKNPEAAKIIFDRGEAILYGIKMLTPGGVLLIAGKGHEQVQESNNKKAYWDDIAFVSSLLTEESCNGL